MASSPSGPTEPSFRPLLGAVARLVVVASAFAIFATGAASAASGERQKAIDTEDCRSDDVEAAVRGCTALLERGTMPAHERLAALEFRAAALLSSGDLARGRGRFEEAASRFEHARIDAEQFARLAGRAEERAVALDLAGRALFGLGRWEAAASAFSDALAADPSSLDDRVNRARSLANLGRDDAARADFDAVVAARRNQAGPYLDRGRFLFARGLHRAAEDDFERAVAFAPNNAVVYYWRGRAKARLDDLDGAGADLDAAIHRDRRFAAALVERALLYERTDQWDRAVDLYRRAAEGPDGDRDVERARARLAETGTRTFARPEPLRRIEFPLEQMFDTTLARRN